MIDFRTDLEIAVEGVKRDYGTIRKVELKLASKYYGVCFFDPVTCATGNPFIQLEQQKINVPWAQEACKIKSANVFIIPRIQDLSIPDIQVDPPGYVCIPNINGFTLRMEGTGKKAKISQWESQ
jgi:hypothetical protein